MAFGGPVAHLAHFQKELIEKKKWLSSDDYADLIAFCQFLPGPASSQVGMGLGLMRAGFFGMLAAWFAFSLPSVLLLLAAAAGVGAVSGGGSPASCIPRGPASRASVSVTGVAQEAASPSR